MQNQNPYLGLSRKEIKTLLRANKGNEAALAQLNAALEAQTPYKAGRLKENEMSEVASILEAVQSGAQVADLSQRAGQALTLLTPFKKQAA